MPKGNYIVQVNSDSFDDDILLYFAPDANPSEYTEILLTINNPESPYIIQGQILFIHASGEILFTNDTAVKQSIDVSFISYLGNNNAVKFHNPTIKYIN